MAFIFLFLAYYTQYDHLQVHPCCCNGIISFFLRLSSIPLFTHTHTHTHHVILSSHGQFLLKKNYTCKDPIFKQVHEHSGILSGLELRGNTIASQYKLHEFKQELLCSSSVKWNDDNCYLLNCQDRRRQWHPTPVLLPGKNHGQRGQVGCSPWGRQELDTTERLHFIFSLSCIGEGNGNPLQCSCLEFPRDGGAWWAAVYGVAQSQT